MSDVQEIKNLLATCTDEQRQEVFAYLRGQIQIHPLEGTLHAKAEGVLEAIHRSGEFTQRMFKGVIAGAAFDVEVADRLPGWQKLTITGDPPYDTHLKDSHGEVKVQVKLQRSKSGQPMTARQAVKGWSENLYVTETQKTRSGMVRGSKTRGVQKTRPYRFGEFDILAVAMYPSTKRWDRFMFTVAHWLVPEPKDGKLIRKFQPVSGVPNADWTDDFLTAVNWFRAGTKRTIQTA